MLKCFVDRGYVSFVISFFSSFLVPLSFPHTPLAHDENSTTHTPRSLPPSSSLCRAIFAWFGARSCTPAGAPPSLPAAAKPPPYIWRNSGLLGPRGAVHSSTRPAGDAVQTAAPPCRSPHVHGVLQSGHFVIGQEVIDGRKVLPELLLEHVHPERVCTHVAASTWERGPDA